MITAKQMLDKIKWSFGENIYDWKLQYFDRIKKENLEIEISSINNYDSFSFDKENDDTTISSIPLHRIRKFLKNDKVVWSRDKKVKNDT